MVNIDIYAEAAMIAEHFAVQAETDQRELRSFALSLQSISRCFPKL